MSLELTIRRYRLKQSSQRWADIALTAAGGADARVLVLMPIEPPFTGSYGADCTTTLLAVASRADMATLPTAPPETLTPTSLWRAAAVSLCSNTEWEMLKLLEKLVADLQDNLTNIQGYPLAEFTVVNLADS